MTSTPTSTTYARVEWIAWTPMLVLILVFGVFPNLLFRLFDPPVTDLVARLDPRRSGR